MIRGAIFDADGTLLDSMGMWDTAGKRYLAGLGIVAKPGLREVLFPLSVTDSAAYLKVTYALPMSTEEIIAGINRVILRFYQEEVRLKPGVRSFLEQLRDHGVPRTLATNTDRLVILEGLRHTGILSLFAEIFTCGELGIGKEKPDIFHLAAHKMGTLPEETWVFEDAVHAAQTAHQAGYCVAGVYDPYSDQAALQAVSDLYLRDLTNFETFYVRAKK